MPRAIDTSSRHCFTLILVLGPGLALGACDTDTAPTAGGAGGGGAGNTGVAGFAGEVSGEAGAPPGGEGGSGGIGPTLPPRVCPDTPQDTRARLLRVPDILPPDVIGSRAMAVSADGNTVVGAVSRMAESPTAFPETYQAYRWSPNGGLTLLETPAGWQSHALAVSADGSVIVGDVYSVPGRVQAARWTAGGLEILPTLEGTDSAVAKAVSADGMTIGGTCYPPGAAASIVTLWTPTDTQTLTSPPTSVDFITGTGFHDLDDAAANAVGGRVEVGNAVVWRELGAPEDLLVAGASNTTAYGLAGDGSLIVGSASIGGNIEPYRWNTSDLQPEPLGFPPGSREVNGSALASDRGGDVVVGVVGYINEGDAVIWDRSRGARFLADILTEAGEDLYVWHLKRASGVSADGRVVAGDADCGRWRRAFYARLPAPDAADAGTGGADAGVDASIAP